LNDAPRVHIAARRRGSGVAARGARAAPGDGRFAVPLNPNNRKTDALTRDLQATASAIGLRKDKHRGADGSDALTVRCMSW
jgi:hypothetical protein